MIVLAVSSASCVSSGLIDPVCQGVSSIGSSIVSSGASDIFDSLTTWVGSGSAWLLTQVGSALNSSTTVTLNAPWFLIRYHAAEALLGVIALPLLLATAIQAIVQQRPGLLIRAAFVQLPLAMVLAGAAVELTTMAISITDDLSAAMSSSTPGAIQSLMTSITSMIQSADVSSGSSVPAFIGLLAGLLVAIAALVLWIELVIRSAAIYVAVAFLPLVLVSLVWPSLTSWSRRLGETLLALILSKLVVVVVLEMAVGALGDQQNQGFSTIVTGIGLLVMATFAPFSLLRLIPMIESSAAMSLEGLRSRAISSVSHGLPRQAAQMAMGMPMWSGGMEASLMSAGAASSNQGFSSTVGVQREEDPMSESAVNNVTSPGPSPTQPASSESTSPRSGTSAERERPTIWPSGEEKPNQPTSTAKKSSLIIERDEMGPVIRQRPADD